MVDKKNMTGTPKQIAWAEKIRAQKMPALIKLLYYQHDNSQLQDRVRKIVREAIDNDDASYWIAHRKSTLETLLRAQEYSLKGEEPPDREAVAKAEAEAEAIIRSKERPSFIHPDDEWQFR
ncbi:MAG TPA: hypothetical protein VG269_17380 [Tepidisphaeraceae bacterium]|jgi:hypothetical protein|nr:hypothetical protein [Tepidisphaeraceae bacterium]